MPATITNYSVPSTKYRYKFPGPGVADSEHLQLTVDPTLVGPKVGRAVLVLDVKTPWFPGSIPPTPGISNVTISLCVPMSTLANEVLYPPHPPLSGPLLKLLRLPPIGLLPESIRRGYGFRWERRHELALQSSVAATRGLLRLSPPMVRYWPFALTSGATA